MEARQIRRRHFFHSSVGSLLNENYSFAALTPASARTSSSPPSRNHCNSVDGSVKYIDTPDHKLLSDLREEKDSGNLDPEALSCKPKPDSECSSDRYARSQSAVSVKSSGSCLGVPRKLGANRSTLTWPEYNGQASRKSTPSCITSETDTYRPFSSTTNDFIGGKFRFSSVATPQSVDHITKLESPKYYDAYREIMNEKSKSHSSVCSVTQGDADFDTLAKIEFPCNPQVTQFVEKTIRRASRSHSTGSAQRASSSHSTGSAQRASSSHSTGSVQRASSNRSVTPVSSRVFQQKCVTPSFPCDRRKSRSRSSTASLWKEQKPNFFYTGRTPSRTPSPDYRLPVFPSQTWVQHYSPTYIRHFMRAANAAIKN